MQLDLTSVTSHMLKNSCHIAEYRLDIVWGTVDADMLEWFFQTQ